jgi:phosphoglycolate phosphatase
MTVKVIIFDFDGTVADTLDAIAGIINRGAVEFGYEPFSQEDISKFRNLNSRQIIQRSGVPIFKLPFIIRRLKIDLSKKIKELIPFTGIKEVLIELKNQDYHLGFITSNSKDNVLSFLENNELKEIFDFVYSEPTIFGKSRVIKHFLKQQKLTPEEVIYVADETRDIEAAKKNHVKIVSVGWGFNSPQVLAKYNPDFLIYQPHELIEVIASLK